MVGLCWQPVKNLKELCCYCSGACASQHLGNFEPATAMGVRRNFSRGGHSRHFAYLFQFVGDATQMDVHKKIPMLRQHLHTVFSI